MLIELECAHNKVDDVMVFMRNDYKVHLCKFLPKSLSIFLFNKLIAIIVAVVVENDNDAGNNDDIAKKTEQKCHFFLETIKFWAQKKWDCIL